MCGIFGVIDKRRQMMDGSGIRQALSMMNERGSGEGAGYVAYGVYPEFRDYFALHVFFDNIHETKPKVDALLHQWGRVVHDDFELRHAAVGMGQDAFEQGHDVLVIEDNPYGELRFEGTSPDSLKSMDRKGQVVTLGTFSKIFAPGLRVAWVCADPEFLTYFCNLKEAADLHTSTLSQYEIDAFLASYDLDAHVERLITVYRERRDIMVEAMAEHFPKSVTFTRPEGGLFTWATLPEKVNARQLFVKALEKKVAFVPGGAFYPNAGRENAMRLNYSNMPPERIREGVGRLGEVMKAYL